MFIDAVSDLIKKIEDPKVKPAIKEDLKKELRDLDTKGEIQAFVKGRGPRPDLSARITESMYVVDTAAVLPCGRRLDNNFCFSLSLSLCAFVYSLGGRKPTRKKKPSPRPVRNKSSNVSENNKR